MKTQSFKALSESAKCVMLGEVYEAAKAPEVNVDALTADAAPETEAPEAEEPEAEETPAPKKSGEKPKYAAQCMKDGEEATVLLSKEELEQLIHENGTKCVIKLYELGKEAKVPTVKVKA